MTVHPYLPCGMNASDIDGDEVDGAGINWSLEPAWSDMVTFYPVLIITDEMLDVFGECPDLILPCDDNLIELPCADDYINTGRMPPVYVVEDDYPVLCFPSERDEIDLPHPDDALTLPGGLPEQSRRLL